MVKLKFLVTGSAGLIGRQVVKDLSETHEVFSCYNKSEPEHGSIIKMDLLNHEMISNVMSEKKPDVVIHLGAMTAVDLCDAQQDNALKINSQATEILAKECSKIISNYNANLVGYACLIDRSNENLQIKEKIISQIKFEIKTFKEDSLPEDLKKIKPVKPGSRILPK